MNKEGAYNSGKPGNLWELVNSGKFRQNWGYHGGSPTAIRLGDPACLPLELHLTTSELWFGQEQEGILP